MEGDTVKIAIYARVSTDDKDQNVETQLIHLRKYAETFRHDIVEEFVDEGKSAKTVRGRNAYIKMMEGVHRHKYEAVVAYKLDRFHRNTYNALAFAEDLREHQTDLILTTQDINTSTAAGRMMMQILAVFAELESENTAERVKVGMERAAAEGKICHRPKRELSAYQIEKAKEILATDPNISQRKLSEQFTGVSRATLIKCLREEGVIT